MTCKCQSILGVVPTDHPYGLEDPDDCFAVFFDILFFCLGSRYARQRTDDHSTGDILIDAIGMDIDIR